MLRSDHIVSPWVAVPTRRPDAGIRLFCFPHAGVGASAYRGWGEAAPPELEICIVQMPGRENRLRERALATMGEIVTSVATAVEQLTDGPFAFFGHSLGAIIAFETARALRRAGNPLPVALFASASRAPQLPWRHPPIRHLDDLALLQEVDRRYASVPEVILADEELRGLLTPALRADLALVETYRCTPEAPFDFPLVVFGGNTDRMVARAELEGWRLQTSGPFALQMVSEGHLFLQSRRSELLAEVANTLHLASDRFAAPSAD